MNSMIRYALFASALTAAAFLGSFFTERGYEMRGNELQMEQIAAQNKNSSEIKDGSGSSNSLESTSSPELVISSPTPIKNSSAIKPDPMAAAQAAKEKVSQATAKVQSPALLKKDAADKLGQGDKKNAIGNSPVQNSPAVDEIASARAQVASLPDKENSSLEYTSQYPKNSSLDMLAILSSLLKLSDGKPLGTEAIEDKTLLLMVWASWCGPCREQLSTIDMLNDTLNNPGLEVIVLAVDENPDDIRRFIAGRPIKYPIVILDGRTADQLQVNAVPSVYMVNSRGKLRVKIRGDGDFALYEQKILGVLAEASSNQEKPSAILKLAEGEAGPRL